jgi:teichuronic acid biosynthesis glycosyltransferase TuaC
VNVRALIVTNMHPSAERPARGRFVLDQVAALRRLEGVEVEVFEFDGGGARAYLTAARELRARYAGREPFDVVHAHFGLTAWPSLAAPGRVRAVTLHGTDLAHPRSRPVSLAALRLMDVVGAASGELAGGVPGWALRGGAAVQELPCGVDLERFRPLDRGDARRALGLGAEGPYLLLAADPARPEKRHDLALAAAAEVELLTLGKVEPERVPLYVNAANAVLVPSDREGFGLAVLEALACEVPVLATPHGVAPEVLGGVEGTLCAPFEVNRWRSFLAPLIGEADPRVTGGREQAARFSADAMALRVLEAWRRALSAADP